MKRSMLLLCFLGSTVAAFGQMAEVSLSFGKSTTSNTSLGDNGAGTVYDYKTNFRMDLRMTLNTWRYLGHEFGYGYTRGKVTAAGQDYFTMPTHMGYYNFLAYATPEGSRIRPFGGAGVHFASFSPPGASVSYGNTVTKFGINFGGGLKVRVTDMFMARLDVHDYLTPKPDFQLLNEHGWLRFLTVTAGVAFVF